VAFVVNENPEEFNRVAVPIRAGDGTPAGALGVSGPQNRLRPYGTRRFVPEWIATPRRTLHRYRCNDTGDRRFASGTL
jgi:DNA-binding IclR family transcriptional regulator